MGPRLDAGKQQCWLDLVRRWQNSQLSVRQFCHRHHVSEASFYGWRRVLRQRGLLADAPPLNASPAFVKVALAAETNSATPVEVLLGQRVLRVHAGFDADTLLQLVRLLEDPSC